MSDVVAPEDLLVSFQVIKPLFRPLTYVSTNERRTRRSPRHVLWSVNAVVWVKSDASLDSFVASQSELMLSMFMITKWTRSFQTTEI